MVSILQMGRLRASEVRSPRSTANEWWRWNFNSFRNSLWGASTVVPYWARVGFCFCSTYPRPFSLWRKYKLIGSWRQRFKKSSWWGTGRQLLRCPGHNTAPRTSTAISQHVSSMQVCTSPVPRWVKAVVGISGCGWDWAWTHSTCIYVRPFTSLIYDNVLMRLQQNICTFVTWIFELNFTCDKKRGVWAMGRERWAWGQRLRPTPPPISPHAATSQYPTLKSLRILSLNLLFKVIIKVHLSR